MKLAARVTDLTTHGSPLSPGPGSPDTIIGGLPAWRTIVDQHACPAASIAGPTAWASCVVPDRADQHADGVQHQDIVVEKPRPRCDREPRRDGLPHAGSASRLSARPPLVTLRPLRDEQGIGHLAIFFGDVGRAGTRDRRDLSGDGAPSPA